MKRSGWQLAGQFISGLSVIVVAFALAGLLLSALGRTLGKYTHDDWMLFWTAAGPVVMLATLFVVAVAAAFAKSQVDTLKESSRVELSNSVLNSDWVNRGQFALHQFMNQYAGGNWVTAKSELVAVLGNPQANSPAFQAASDVRQSSVAAYVYLARLYNRNVLDNELVMESAAFGVVEGVFVIEPLLRELIHAGALDDDILDLARVCLTRFKKRPEILVFYPFLRDWAI